MKLSILVAGLIAAAITSAGPLSIGPRSGHTYRLKVSAPGSAELDGKYLALANNAAGIYGTGLQADATVISASTGSAPGLFELHTMPVGIVDHALGLVGTNGLLDLVDVVNPARRTFPNGTTYYWRDFALGGAADVDVDAGTDAPAPAPVPAAASGVVSLGAPGAEDRWTAWPGAEPGTWQIKWWTGSGSVIQVYQPVDLVYEQVED